MELKKYLKSNHIKMRPLSEALGIHYMHLSNIVRGVRRPSSGLALRIEQATGGAVTRMELLYPEDKQK